MHEKQQESIQRACRRQQLMCLATGVRTSYHHNASVHVSVDWKLQTEASSLCEQTVVAG